MDKLTQARARINEIDAQIAPLFEERCSAVEDVIAISLKTAFRYLMRRGEDALLERNSAFIQDEAYRPYYTDFQRAVSVFPSSISEAFSLRAPLPIRGQRARMPPLR